MRIALVDFGGYAFPFQLSRALAGHGHVVHHFYCADVAGPKGDLERRAGDPDNFTILPVSLGQPFQKYNFLRRRRQEILLGRKCADAVTAFAPDLVLCANTPLDFLEQLVTAAERIDARIVYWLQDIMSVAIRSIVKAKLGALGELVARYYTWKERRILQHCDAVIAISQRFFDVLEDARLPPQRRFVIPNWAPLPEIDVLPRDNAWARAHGLSDLLTIIYSGTIGLKHSPQLFVELAKALRSRPDIRVVVVSEGAGADWITRAKTAENLPNLLLLPFQPAELLPMVLASADILMATIEADAALYSVPSKILSYFCAGRPVVLSVPPDNDAARVVDGQGLGQVAPPGNASVLADIMVKLLDDPQSRHLLGQRARRYAEEQFEISRIARKFEIIFEGLLSSPRG